MYQVVHENFSNNKDINCTKAVYTISTFMKLLQQKERENLCKRNNSRWH